MAQFAVSLLYIIFNLLTKSLKCLWVQSNVAIPRMIDESAVGFYNDEIYIFGGGINPRQIIRYNPTRNAFIDDGIDLLSVDTYSSAQFYSQINNMLYFINGDTFSVYNFITKEFTDNWNNIKTPVTVDIKSCLSATDEYLFVIGGRTSNDVTHNTVQILHLLNTEWSLSYMNTGRSGHSCAINQNMRTLYVFGGWNDFQWLDSIEILNISDIEKQYWINLDETLTVGLDGTRALSHEETNRIFVIGGAAGKKAQDSMHIINTVTNQVTLSSYLLPYKVTTTAALIVDNILYGFGGWDAPEVNSAINTWIFYIISINEPTMTPTHLPFAQTSAPPSNAPSDTPSDPPSNAPSDPPSNAPSDTTSAPPSNAPSDTPSDPPSNAPSDTPSNASSDTPSAPPSNAPSDTPSDPPSNAPSDTPSDRPSNAPSDEPSTQPRDAPYDATSISIEFSNTTTFTVNNTTKSPSSMLYIYITVILIAILCCNCCGAFLCCKYFKVKKCKKRKHKMINIQMGSQSSHDEYVKLKLKLKLNLEREIVASWLRNTVQLPQYIDLFLAQGYENMESIQAIADEDDLRELGIKLVGHRINILGEIKLLRDTQFVIKGITRRVDGNKITESRLSDDSGSLYLDGNEITTGTTRGLPITTTRGLPEPNDSDSDSDGMYIQRVGEQNEECLKYTAEGEYVSLGDEADDM